MENKVRVIIVTDGDYTAQKAVKQAANNLGLYPLMITGGNPTRLSGEQVINLILSAPKDPLVIMVDDKGEKGRGKGEKIIDEILDCPDIEILGVVAVASNTKIRGVEVDLSVNIEGKIVAGPVDKDGFEESYKHKRLEGDTVEILKYHPELLVVGTGDLGKMYGIDSDEYGAMITTKCFKEILERSGTSFV